MNVNLTVFCSTGVKKHDALSETPYFVSQLIQRLTRKAKKETRNILILILTRNYTFIVDMTLKQLL